MTKNRELQERRKGAALVVAVTGLLLLSAGAVTAAGRAADDEYARRLASREEMVNLSGDGEESVLKHLESFNIPVEYVAQYHPLPARTFAGPSLLDKGARAKASVEEVGRLVGDMRARVVPGDKPNQYVVEQADKALSELSSGYNDILVPAGRELDRIERNMKQVAGILFVIAPGNGGGGDNGAAAAASAAAVEDAKLKKELDDAQEKRQKEAEGAALSIDSGSGFRDRNVIHVKTAAEAVKIEAQAKSELGLMTVALAQLRDAQSSARKMASLLSRIGPVLERAEGVQAALTEKDGEYRKGMKGSAAGAKSSELALNVAIDSVGDFATRAAELSGRMNNLLDGGFGTAVDNVLRCSQENLKMARTLQGEDVFQVKKASIESALAKNLAAVRAIEAMSPEFHYILDAKGGSLLALGGMQDRTYAEFKAPKAGAAGAVDGDKALKHTVEEGAKLMR